MHVQQMNSHSPVEDDAAFIKILEKIRCLTGIVLVVLLITILLFQLDFLAVFFGFAARPMTCMNIQFKAQPQQNPAANDEL
jgi:hypothetical protein